MKLGDVMDEIAARVRQAPSLAGRTYAGPVGTITPPAAIVDFPSQGKFDETYGRGMDRMTGALAVCVGRPDERSTRDRLTKYLDGSGPESIKALVDGDDYSSCDSVRVTGWETEVWTIAGIDYLAAVFEIDIAGQGA
jgi:hypothetical protein